MNRLKTGIVVGVLTILTASAGAQTTYPNKPIRLIVPIIAGGQSDAAARALAKGLSAGLGQQDFLGRAHHRIPITCTSNVTGWPASGWLKSNSTAPSSRTCCTAPA